MPSVPIIVVLLALLVSIPAAAVKLTAAGAALPQSQTSQNVTPQRQTLAGAVRPIETKQESEKAFQHDIVAVGYAPSSSR